VGIVAHFATLYFLPQTKMAFAMSNAAEQSGWNKALHPARATAQSRTIVRPSPDLLYTLCAYDLAQGPLRVSSPLPKGTYWSVALYADNTDNFFVVNDRQAGPLGLVDFLVYEAGTSPPPDDLPKIKSPSVKGVVLMRTVIHDESKLAELDALRREAKCEPFSSAPPAPAVPTPHPKPADRENGASPSEGTGNN
jgi:uncharacterized membrane protein